MKIAGFNGKFQQSDGGTTTPVEKTSSASVGKTNLNKTEPPRSFKLKMAMAETQDSLQIQREEGKV